MRAKQINAPPTNHTRNITPISTINDAAKTSPIPNAKTPKNNVKSCPFSDSLNGILPRSTLVSNLLSFLTYLTFSTEEKNTMDVSGKVIGAVSIVVIVIVLLSMTPTVVDQVAAMATGGWNFTGHDGAISLLGLVPFIWIASILVAASVGMFALAKGSE